MRTGKQTVYILLERYEEAPALYEELRRFFTPMTHELVRENPKLAELMQGIRDEIKE
jgi:hypothetical protein